MPSEWVQIKDLGLVGWQPDLIGQGKALNAFDRAVNVRPIGNNIANAGGYGYVVGYGDSCVPDYDFAGDLAPAEWTEGADATAVGTSVVWSAPSSVLLTGSDDEGGAQDGNQADVWIEWTATRNGSFQLTYVWTKLGIVGEGSLHDPFGYTIDGGDFVPISRDCDTGCPETETGAESIDLTAGQVLRLILRSVDNNGGAATVELSGVAFLCTGGAIELTRSLLFPSTLFSFDTTRVWWFDSLLSVLNQSPILLGGNAAIADQANATNGKAINVNMAESAILLDLFPKSEELRYRAVGIRFYLDTDLDLSGPTATINFWNLFSPGTEITGPTEERGVYFRFSNSNYTIHHSGFQLNVFGDSGASASRVSRSISSGLTFMSAGWHTLIFQYGNDVTGEDASIRFDGVDYFFDTYDYSLDTTPDYDLTDGCFLGVNPINVARYPLNLRTIYIDSAWYIHTLNFPGTELTSAQKSQLEVAMNSAELNPLPSKLTGLPLWDIAFSAPLTDDLGNPNGTMSQDQLTYTTIASGDRDWITLVTDRALSRASTAVVALRLNILNPDGLSASEILQNLVLGITGDTPLDNYPYESAGFRPFVGRYAPSLGIVCDNGAATAFHYQDDYSYAIGQAEAGFPTTVVNSYDLVIDMGAKTFMIYTTGACGQALSAKLPFDFKDDYVRFAVSIRRPLAGQIGVQIVRTDTYCEGSDYPSCEAAF